MTQAVNNFFIAFIIALLAVTAASTKEEVNPRVQELQRGLDVLGYDPGPKNGFLGPDTVQAIEDYQKDNDLPINGEYSGLLLLSVNQDVAVYEAQNTPEGRARQKKKERLVKLSDRELIDKIENSKNEKAQEIINLLGERALELPARLLFESLGLPTVMVEQLMYMPLGGLFYPRSPDGVKQFQRDMGGTPTGDLTMQQFQLLNRRYTRYQDTPVYVGGLSELNIYKSNGYLIVSGTWILEDENIAFPVNKSEIKCERSIGECQITQAELLIPSLDSSDEAYHLNLSSSVYNIVSWDNNEILAKDVGKCRTTTLTINTNSNEVFEVTRNNKTERCEEALFSMPRLEKPRIAKLVPGFDTIRDWWNEREDQVKEYVNPRLAKKLQKYAESNAD